MIEPQLHSAVETADALGVSLEWLRRQCRAQTVPHVRIARQYRFSDADVAAIIAQLAVTAKATDDATEPEAPAPRASRKHATYNRRPA